MSDSTTQQVIIPYKPREWAKHVHESDKRWKVLVLHRRAGKTTAAINHLQRDALTIPNSRYAYVSPTYKMSKNVCWDIIKFYARPIPKVEFNESELTVKYPNGSRLTLYGADNPDSLRGIGLWGVVFDEYSQQPSNIFTEIIRPALADHGGYAIWIGTPKGKNEFYRLYEQGKKDEAWLALLLTVEDTKLIKEEELADAQKIMSDDEFQQEWHCSFEAAIKGAYYASEIAEARREGRIKLIPYDPILKVHTVWDLGKGANMAVGFYQRVTNEMRWIDYLEGSGDEAMPEVIAKVLNKKYVYGKHFAPHDIKATELATGKTRIDTAKTLGIDFEVVPMLSVDERIDKAKIMFQRLWINELKCQLALDAILQYRREWDDKRGMFKENPYHDWTSHAADQLSYAAVIEEQMTNEERKMKQYRPQWKSYGSLS